jgi:anti-anti-sigma regulatory factor
MAVPPSSAGVPSPKGSGREPRIDVDVTEAPAEVIVHVAGEACISQAGALAAGLLGLSARRPSLVTLDLSGLNCLSTLAMEALVAFRRGVLRAGGRVRLAATLQEPVREALGRAGLLALFGLPEGA